MIVSLEAITCSVCLGIGTVIVPPDRAPNTCVSLEDFAKIPCHQCGGSGVAIAVVGSIDAMLKRISFIDASNS